MIALVPFISPNLNRLFTDRISEEGHAIGSVLPSVCLLYKILGEFTFCACFYKSVQCMQYILSVGVGMLSSFTKI